MHKRFRQFLFLGTIAGALVATRVFGSSQEREIEVLAVKPRQVYPLILASGQITYAREVPLSSELVARVARVAIREGDRVHAGDALLQLESSTFLAQVAQYEAQVKQAEIQIASAQLDIDSLDRDLTRKKQLADANFLGRSALDDATKKLDAARIAKQVNQQALRQAQGVLDMARENLAKTTIRAPIDGTVVAVPIRIGETAVPSSSGIPGSALMTVADTSAMLAEVLVDEAEVSSVSLGQSAKVYPSGRDDLVFRGKVTRIALMPKAGSHNYLVRVALDDPGPQLRSGMSCRVELQNGHRAPSLAVPLQAVQTGAAGTEGGTAPKAATQIWVLHDGRVTRRAITLGVSDDSYQEVRSGLRAGDQVLVGPIRDLHELSEGEAVRAKPWREGSAS
jgi:HlyD family secretion protein